MTYHRAKGMEFTHVILFGVGEEARYDPARTAYDEQSREAAELRERSLLYVAATRARDQLAITWSGRPHPYIEQVVTTR